MNNIKNSIQSEFSPKKINIINPVSKHINTPWFHLCITIVIVLLLIFTVFHDFILGKSLYLFKDITDDSINITYPVLYYTLKYFHLEGFPLWSFSQGVGQDIMPTSLIYPFYWVVYAGGIHNVAYMMAWMEIAKILATAIIFFLS